MEPSSLASKQVAENGQLFWSCNLQTYCIATSVVAPHLTYHPFLSRVTIIANNYHGIPPRFRNVAAITVGHDKGCYAQLEQNYQQPNCVEKFESIYGLRVRLMSYTMEGWHSCRLRRWIRHYNQMNLCLISTKNTWWRNFLLQREEEGKVTAKIQNRQNLLHVLKIEHTFPQGRSSTINDFTMQYYLHSQQDVNAPWRSSIATQEQLSALPGVTNVVLRCYSHLTVEEGHIDFQWCISLGNKRSLSNQ